MSFRRNSSEITNIPNCKQIVPDGTKEFQTLQMTSIMRMTKYLILVGLFAVFSFSAAHAQSRLDLTNKSIESSLLVEILTYGEMKEIKRPAWYLGDFFLRLYSIEGKEWAEVEEDYCAGGAEVEIYCSYSYFLAVGVGSLGVPGAVYDLGEVGEISKIDWIKIPDTDDFVRLRLEISNYPKLAFKYNPKLVRKTRIVEIDVNLSSLKIKVLK